MYAVIESGGKQYRVEEGSSLLVDRLDVKQGDKVSLRPVMFRDAEVLVKIDEPHMYNADDAVARIDSYIVSVTGGGPFVGERKLVRIDDVHRSEAVASLLGGADSPNGNGSGAEENGSQLESDAPSRRRSRGRRGGRERSRAKQASTDE